MCVVLEKCRFVGKRVGQARSPAASRQQNHSSVYAMRPACDTESQLYTRPTTTLPLIAGYMKVYVVATHPYVQRNVSLDMDGSDSFLDILPQHRVVICTQCQYAITPSSVKEHLRTNHKRLTLQHRREIIDTVAKNRSLAQTSSEVIYPLPTNLPVQSLPCILMGFDAKQDINPMAHVNMSVVPSAE